MQEKYLKPLNPYLDFKLIPIFNEEGKAFKVIDGVVSSNIWFYSDNNISIDRNELYDIAGKIDDEYKFSTELTTLAGNLFRLILSGSHPEYYPSQIVNPSPRDKTSFVRSCKEIIGFTEWQHCVKVSEQGISVFEQFYSWENPQIPVKGMTSMLVAGLFLAECDWSPSNFGLIKGENQLIRIDPGLSFDNSFLDNDHEKIYNELSNLLENYIYKMTGENYFQEFKASSGNITVLDSEESSFDSDGENPTALLHNNVMQLFCSKHELFETLYKICSLTDNDYFKEVQKISSGDYQKFWNKFLFYFNDRIACFKSVALKLDGFSEYMTHKNSNSLHQPMNEITPVLPLVTQNVTYNIGSGLNFFTHFVPGPEIQGFWRYPNIAPPSGL